MIPNDIAFILGKPGKYVISADPHVRLYLMVEVDEHRQLHQLNKAGERDGVLNHDGWVTANVKAFTVHEENGQTVFRRVGLPPGAGVEVPLP